MARNKIKIAANDIRKGIRLPKPINSLGNARILDLIWKYMRVLFISIVGHNDRIYSNSNKQKLTKNGMIFCMKCIRSIRTANVQ